MKKYVCALLFVLLSFSLFSCGGGGDEPCSECIDTNGDGKCDTCEKEMPKPEIKDVVLIEEGEAKFQIVIAKSAGAQVRNHVNSKLAGILRNRYDVDVTVMVEDSDNDAPADIEVLIGDVKNRGDEYLYDVHTLGNKGYVVSIVGNKIIINGGSDSAIVEALEIFGDDIIGFITRGHGVSIHTRKCSNVPKDISKAAEPERWINARWDTKVQNSYRVTLAVTCIDRVGELYKRSEVLE